MISKTIRTISPTAPIPMYIVSPFLVATALLSRGLTVHPLVASASSE
jgi:hypothetical protein